MIIGGWQKFSLLDYPGKISAIIFTRGCNFRCPYCHNPELVLPAQFQQEISLSKIYDFLTARRNKLDAVCITGGEPTLHYDLLEMISQIKKLGFLVKLDTNGTNPQMLKQIIRDKLVNYFAMDIKAPLSDYSRITGQATPVAILQKSIGLIINSGVDHEFRTTIVKELLTFDDLREIAKTIKGANNYFLQQFTASKLVDQKLQTATTYQQDTLASLAKELSFYVKNCQIR